MPRIRLIFVVVVAAFALVAAGTALALAAHSGAQATQQLVGNVGPGHTITLEKGGKAVKTLQAGTYKITVHGRAKIHDFHLFGPGVNKKTGVAFKGTVVWTVKLKKGDYSYRCDVLYKSGELGHFKVSAKTPTPAPS